MRAADGLQSGAWFALQAALIAAPWMYGSTRHWALVVLCQVLTVVTAGWVSAAWFKRRVVSVDRYLALPILFLFLSGWLVVLTGARIEADPFNTKHFADLSQRWPGSFIVKSPVETMWLFSGLFGALLLVSDPSTGAWRRSSSYNTLVCVGASISLLGIVQVQLKAPAILWDMKVPFTGYFFATFFQHTNAASFLNLVWPLAAGVLVARISVAGAMERKDRRITGLWVAVFVIGLSGLAAQVSVFGVVNAAILMALLLGWVLWRLPARYLVPMVLRFCIVAAICGCAIGGVVVFGKKWPGLKARWHDLQVVSRTAVPVVAKPEVQPKGDFRMRADGLIDSPGGDSTAQGRLVGYRRLVKMLCLQMVPKGGLLGFGPGSWSRAYPHFTNDPLMRTFYLQMQFAHQDYLQAVVEWGVLGAVAWALVIGGAIRGGLCRLRRFRMAGGSISVEEGRVAGALVAIFGVGLHGLFDFPLQVPSIQLYVVVLLGLLWSAGAQARSRKAFRPSEDVASKPATT